MGALHHGHLKLLKQSLDDNDISVVSIFVNPLQFNNREDLALYPRTLSSDLDMLREAGCQIAFIPETESMYKESTKITLDFGSLGASLEGQFRPGHFSGVGVVVAKLLHMTMPDKAYFGLKDLQQCAVIQTLVNDLGFPVTLRFIETMREADGLAMSSRNVRLSADARQKAPLLYHTLQLVKSKLTNESVADAKKAGLDFLDHAGINKVEYLEIVDFSTMQPITDLKNSQKPAVCIAAWLEGVRLIDNVFV
jgi:pantoate--beta-alanine ligase